MCLYVRRNDHTQYSTVQYSAVHHSKYSAVHHSKYSTVSTVHACRTSIAVSDNDGITLDLAKCMYFLRKSFVSVSPALPSPLDATVPAFPPLCHTFKRYL